MDLQNNGIPTDSFTPIDLKKKVEESRRVFYARRARAEQQLATWQRDISQCSEDFFEGLPFDPRTLTLQEEIPEWYKESGFNREVANAQWLAFSEKIQLLRERQHQYYLDAIEKTKEYDALNMTGGF